MIQDLLKEKACFQSVLPACEQTSEPAEGAYRLGLLFVGKHSPLSPQHKGGSSIRLGCAPQITARMPKQCRELQPAVLTVFTGLTHIGILGFNPKILLCRTQQKQSCILRLHLMSTKASKT